MWEEEELKFNAYGLCRDMLGGAWSNISVDEMEINHVSGGLSNHLHLCRLPADVETTDDEPRAVLLRIYGKRDGCSTNLVDDSIIFLLLAERKLGPQLYGIFPSGRLEEYIPSRSSTWKDLRQSEVSIAIAKELAKTHALRVPINKKPTWLLEQMRSWRDFFVNNVSLEDLKSSHKIIATEVLNIDWEKEICWLESQIRSSKSPAVFSHNDLTGGNILLLNKREGKADKSLMFIDYEFGCYNYRGFDIGNHFCEWCYSYNDENYPHFSADLERFPNEKQQRTFISSYLKQMEEIWPNEVNIALEEEILHEVPLFASSANLLWSLWAFNMALTSSITFGYWEGKDKVFLLKLFNEALENKNGSAFLSMPGTSGLAPHRGPSPTPQEKSNGKWCEIVNEVYKDYYHGLSPSSPSSRNAFVGKYDPGYMPAPVPTNNIAPDYSDSDSINSLENVPRNSHRPSVGSTSYDSDSDKKSYRMPRALSPKSRNYSSSSDVMHTSQSDIHSPARKGARRSVDPFPRPGHQPAFQYLARGETPPKINRTSNSSIPSRKGKN